MTKIKKGTIVFTIFGVIFALCFGGLLGSLLALTRNTIDTENFTDFNPALPTKILDINGELITEFSSDEKREMISIDELPQHLIDALITREDRIFYKHRGFSFKSIMRAIVGKLTNMSLGGGSTLTQQIAGTLYCDRTDYSIKRKIVELWWAIQMERRYSKNEILELYINKVYLGGGTYGVNAASKYYFGHSAKEITPAEAAILVIQLSNPGRYNPFDNPNIAMDRQQAVLQQMVDDNYLSKEIADASFEDYWLNFDYSRTSSSAYQMREDAAPWFSEYVLRELNKQIYGTSNLYTDGFTVNTTLNLKHQAVADRVMAHYIEYANDSYENSSNARKLDAANTYIPMTELFSLIFNIPELKNSQERQEKVALSTFKNEINPMLDVLSMLMDIENLKVGIVNKQNVATKETSAKNKIEGTMVSIDTTTGYINSLVGGSSFDEHNQFIRATQATLQPGSSCKPLYYSAAIDSKLFTSASIIYDTPTVFYNNDGSPYYPKNFKDTWEGPVQLWYALSTSMNVPSIKVLSTVGFEPVIERISALIGIDESEREARSIIPVYPLGLGVFTVQPIQMARAFAIFGNQGKEVTPIAIRSVSDRNGKVFLTPEKDLLVEQQAKGDDIQVISPQTAYIMSNILTNTVKSGTLWRGSNYGRKFRYTDANGKTYTIPAAGKTGTTQNWGDAWTVGFTPYYTSAFWFGFDQKGRTLGQLTGATLAGLAWGDYMSEIHQGLPYKDFVKPQNGIIEATVCSVSGQLLSDACGSHKTTQFFLEGTEPTTICELHSTRETTKILIKSRLEAERMQSGVSSFVFDDDTTLKLDLSFLNDDNYGQTDETNDIQETVPSTDYNNNYSYPGYNPYYNYNTTPSQTTTKEYDPDSGLLPETNFLFD